MVRDALAALGLLTMETFARVKERDSL
jgi:hypothetical protein